MVHRRVPLLLVLAVLPTALSQINGYFDSLQPKQVPYRAVYECRGLPEQVYAVRNEVGAVNALLQNATTASTTVLGNQETLIAVSDSLIDRRDEVRFVVQDIRQEQEVNLKASLAALGVLQDTLLADLGDLAGDVTDMQARQEVLKTTLNETAAALAAGREDLSQEVSAAQRQLQDVRGRVLQGIHDTESLQAGVRGLVRLFQGSAPPPSAISVGLGTDFSAYPIGF